MLKSKAMRIDQLTDLFVKQMGARKDGAAYAPAAAVDATPFVSTEPDNAKNREKDWGFGFSKFPINGRVWYPVGDGPFPLVLIVHGNHDPLDYSDPGYAYLGELLASRGFIFASVDENFINGNLRGESDGRAWLLLKHLEDWKRWNDSSIRPFDFT